LVPSTVLGIVAFVAAVGPGYLYVRLAERREPQQERTRLKEAAELTVIGALASMVGLSVALAIGREISLIDVNVLAIDPGRYLVLHPWRALGLLSLIAAVSYGGVFAVSKVLEKRSDKDQLVPYSAWYALFGEKRPPGHGVRAAVGLRDGRVIEGNLYSYTPEAVRDRDIVLHAPPGRKLRVAYWDRVSNRRKEQELQDAFVLFESRDILYVSGTYLAPRGATTTPEQTA
jgi:hypothetical protein